MKKENIKELKRRGFDSSILEDSFKCGACGYQYQEQPTAADVSKVIEGDKKFHRIYIGAAVATSQGEIELYACPRCNTVKVVW